jgi:hypothetical protein
VLKGGAGVAFVEARSGKLLWQKRFAPRGRRPAIGVGPNDDALLVYSEAGRLSAASLGREGIGTVTRFARVVGDQPQPVVAPGGQRGQWYVSWLDYEVGKLEPFVARIDCQSP